MNLENIIARFFTNEASKEELEILNSWKKEGEDNKQALDEIDSIWKASDELKDYQQFDTQKAILKVNSAIVSEELKLPTTQSQPSIIRRIMPLAAGLILVAGLVFGFKYLGNNQAQKAPTEYISDAAVLDIKLADNSIVALDKKSSVNILSDFSKERVVSLSGRAYFEVESDEANPFTIETNHGDVTVVGTKFTLATSQEKTELFLFEGLVKYKHEDRIIDMNASEAILVENGTLTKYRFNSNNINSWKSDELNFEDVYVLDVFKTLERHFQLEINTTSKQIDSSCNLSSSFNSLSLEAIMSELNELFNIDYEMKGQSLIIKKLSC